MSKHNHPITPPPDKIHNWLQLEKGDYTLGQIITLAAQWGADQELEACCEWLAARDLRSQSVAPCLLRAARRPKPPSLKEKAIKGLDKIGGHYIGPGTAELINTIREALEQLPDQP